MQLEKRDIFLFFGLAALVLLLHWPASQAGFVTDFTGLWTKMQDKGFGDALSSFGFPSLMPLLNIFYFLLYKCFGLNGIAWLLCFVCVYVLGLVFFYKSILILVDTDNNRRIALATLLLVVFSPFQVEAMIWKVGLGHISAVSFFLIAFYHSLIYLRNQKITALMMMLVWQAASLFCFEWALVFPLVIGLVGFYLKSHVKWKVILSSVFICLSYLVLTKIFIGKAIGHYDLSIEQVFDLPVLIGAFSKYVLKHFGLIHFWCYDLKHSIYTAADSIWLIGLVVLSVIFACYKVITTKKKITALAATIFLCACVSLILVLPLFFSYTLLSENDRYGSLFVPFFSLFLVLQAFRFKQEVAYALLIGYLAINAFFQQKMIQQWQQSEVIVSSLTNAFPENVVGPSLVLNLPENLNGTFMFRDFSGANPLVDQLSMYGRETGSLDLVAQYNVPRLGQGSIASWLDDNNKIQLENKEWGSWWWRKGIGVAAYETAHYEVDFKGKKLEVTLKDTAYYQHILYVDGNDWFQLK